MLTVNFIETFVVASTFYDTEDYGEHWLDNREGTYADDIARFQDYQDAGKVLRLLSKG